jgi:hypothetical protein
MIPLARDLGRIGIEEARLIAALGCRTPWYAPDRLILLLPLLSASASDPPGSTIGILGVA